MPRRIPDTTKLRNLVGFAPTTDIDEIIDSVMRSFVARQERSAQRTCRSRCATRSGWRDGRDPRRPGSSRCSAAGFVVMATLWLGFSGWVVVDRCATTELARKLGAHRRALAQRSHARDALARSSELGPSARLLDRVPTLDVYRMTGNAELPQLGARGVRRARARARRPAACCATRRRHRGARRKWRRISALHALCTRGPSAIHGLLRVALADADVDVASAAATVLQRIGDRRAAEILIGGLRISRLPASRIAARLERFTIALDDLLRPLLTSPRPEARYWAVTLLRKYHDEAGSPRRSCRSWTTPMRRCARPRC